MRMLFLVLTLALSMQQAHGFGATRCVAPAVVTPQTSRSTAVLAMARGAPAKRKPAKRAAARPQVASPSGKVEGLTSLAPLKFYSLGLALLWAIVGSHAK